MKCPICKSKARCRFTTPDFNRRTEGNYKLYQCLECKLGFIEKDKPIVGLYPKIYYQQFSFFIQILYYLAFVSVFNKIRKDVKGKTMLEIGSGRGTLLAIARENGWQVKGVVLQDSEAEFSKKYYNLDIQQGFFEEIEFDCKFDVILLFNTLEHMAPPPQEVLKKIHQLLNPNGQVIIKVQSFASWQMIFGKYWSALEIPRHLWQFTPQSLRVLAEQSNFKIKKIKNFSKIIGSFFIGRSVINFLIHNFFSYKFEHWSIAGKTKKPLILFIQLIFLPIGIIMEFISSLFLKGSYLYLVLKKDERKN